MRRYWSTWQCPPEQPGRRAAPAFIFTTESGGQFGKPIDATLSDLTIGGSTALAVLLIEGGNVLESRSWV